jgi:hypothetical protein
MNDADDHTAIEPRGAHAERWVALDATSTFAVAATAFAAAMFVVVVAVLLTGAGSDRGDGGRGTGGGSSNVDDGAVADPNVAAEALVADAAAAMGAVESVEFVLERSGAPVFIDEFESIELDRLHGQFRAPERAQAELTVTVDGSLATRLGAVAIDGDVWLSNPVTGRFEPLPPGFDIDPSRFFDPQGGWQPLLEQLQEIVVIGVDDRGGQRYHVRGVAPAAQVADITVGLVTGQDVELDLWIHPGTSLLTAVEFDTVVGTQSSSWVLELGRYGDQFTIEPPDEFAGGS